MRIFIIFLFASLCSNYALPLLKDYLDRSCSIAWLYLSDFATITSRLFNNGNQLLADLSVDIFSRLFWHTKDHTILATISILRLELHFVQLSSHNLRLLCHSLQNLDSAFTQQIFSKRSQKQHFQKGSGSHPSPIKKRSKKIHGPKPQHLIKLATIFS